MKEPEYYGRARYVNEGTSNLSYLEELAYSELDSMATRAHHAGNFDLKTAALAIMSKKYVEWVLGWLKSLNEMDVSECGDYLNQCNELLKCALNNEYKDVLAHVWPKIRERADIIAANSIDCDELSDYAHYRKAAEIFIDSRQKTSGWRRRRALEIMLS